MKFNYAVNTPVVVQLFTINGQQLAEENFEATAGWYNKSIDAIGAVCSGYYLLQVSALGVESMVYKLLKM